MTPAGQLPTMPFTMPMTTAVTESAVTSRSAKWSLIIHWVFCCSVAFDFKAKTDGGQGGSAIQLLFVGLAMMAFGAQAILSWRRLLSRPVAWILLLWLGFLAFHTGNAVLHGVNMGQFIRVVLPYSLIAIGMAETIMAAGHGLRASQLMMPIFVTMPVNIIWRLIHGFAFKGATLETARYDVQSYGSSYLAAYNGALLLLRPKFRWPTVLPLVALAAGILITVTRGLLIPLALSLMLGSMLLILGISWKVFRPEQLLKKIGGLGLFAAGLVGLIAVLAVVQPLIIERWTTRLFNSGGSGQATTKDLSLLSREAEALFMLKALEKEPVSFIWGKGMGSNWGWDPSYYPEMWIVYPADYNFAEDFWFCGHSIWTYATYSGGAIGLLCHLALIFSAIALSIRVFRLQGRAGPHPDTWLACLPIICLLCLISESFTSNPFDERLMGLGIGVTIGMLQALYNDLYQRRVLR